MNIFIIFTLILISSAIKGAVFKPHPKCVFPFKYQGRVFDDCISKDASAPWCSADADYKGLYHYCNNNEGDTMESNGAFLSAQKKLAENSETLKNKSFSSGDSCETCGTQFYIIENSMTQLSKISDDNNRHIDYLLNVENENFKDTLSVNFDDIKDYLNCPSGWYRLSNKECFHFKPNLNFDEARRYCEERGAQVASVNNLEENNILVTKAKQLYVNEGSILLGFTDAESEGNWQWVDGSESKFSNWNKGEPNGRTTENCLMVYLSNGLWNDMSCSIKLLTVCRGDILYVKNL